MAGGLLNLVANGNANVLIHGSPSKTFFKVAYSKITNFGLQKFRLDYDGSRDLRLTEESKFTFRIKRYADLLMDTYLVVNLPDIWSPIYSPSPETNYQWVPYEFRWIRDLGVQMIESVEINCGSVLIQKYTGAYLAAMVERDFSAEKKELFQEMTGNVAELNDPASAYGRESAYPSAYYTPNTNGAEPSIRGRTLYIPINTWFTLNSRCAFPLVCLQYNELTITVTLRPIQELFQVRDVYDTENFYPYIQPDFNREQFRMYRFLQTPPAVRTDSASGSYLNTQQTWNADIHLMATYCFLSKNEAQQFAREDQIYLVKDVFEYKFLGLTGSNKVKLENSNGMVSSWMWFFQRNDVNLRNEWSNYSNWPYIHLPANAQMAPTYITADANNNVTDPSMILQYGPRIQPHSTVNSGLFISGDFSNDNRREIMTSFGILFEGDYRENLMPRGVYDYIEKYTRTAGNAKEGLYCYNFCLNTSPFEYQPSGAINLSKFKNIELEFTTYLPQVDPTNSNFEVICDDTGAPVGVTKKSSWQIYQYSFDMTLYEERYNILSFIGGNCGMMYAR
jgi:Major capsid protein N-terminus/Large eukaryotic DNA virus major capsid protein